MRFRLHNILACCLFILPSTSAIAQCTFAGAGANTHIFLTNITPACGTNQTLNMRGGNYVLFPVYDGASYTFFTCGSPATGDIIDDTQLTLYNNIGGASIAYDDDGCPIPTNNKSIINYTANFTGTGRLIVNAFNCVSSTSQTILTYRQNKPANPPTPTVGTNPNCGSVTLNALASPPTGITYYWQGTTSGGTSLANPASSNFTATVTGTNTYYVRARHDASDCWSDEVGVSATVVAVPPLPGAISASSTAYCQGTTGITYSIAPIANATSYNWVLPAGMSITSGSGTNLITASVSAAAPFGPVTVQVNGVNATSPGCSGPAQSLAVTINPNPDVIASISATQTSICQGQTGVVFSVTPPANTTTYNWVVPPGASIVSGVGTSSITVDFSGAATTGSQTVTVTPANPNCIGVPTNLSVTVTPRPVTPGAISASATTICQGQTGVTFSISGIPNATDYIWTVPTGATINGASTGTSITVDFGASAATGAQVVTVSSNNSFASNCFSSAQSVAITVFVTPADAGSITASQTNICQGQSGVTFSIPVSANATGYTWVIPAGATIIGPATGNSITVDFGAAAPTGAGTVTVTPFAPNCTAANSSIGVTVFARPTQPSSITASGTNICQGQSGVTFSVPAVTNATDYIWVVPTGASIISGAGTNAITVDFSSGAATGAQTVSVTANNSGASSCMSPARNLSITVNPKPADAAVIVTNINPICQGQNGVTYQVTAAAGADVYDWVLPAGTTIVSGANTNSIVVDYGLSAGSGPFTVTVTPRIASTGCVGLSASLPISVGIRPTQSVLATQSVICAGNSSSLVAAGSDSYQWSPATGLSATTGQVVQASPTVTTTYRVVGFNTLSGCSDTDFVTITVFTPATNGTVSSDATVCSGSNGGTLSLTTPPGPVLRWEESIDGGATWMPIANTTTSQSYSNLTQTTKYRAISQGGSCPEVISSQVTITVDPVAVSGVLTGNATVCSGSNSGVIALLGQTGTIQRWEESTDGGITYTPIVNNTIAQGYVNLTQTTLYRAVVVSGVCPTANTLPVTITVDPNTVAGTVSGTASVCATSNSGTLTLTGSTGSVIRWEQSINGGITWTNIANVTTSQNFTNLTQTTAYRALVQSGVCASIYSGSATITVDPANASGSITGTATVCSGSSGTLSLSGQTGAIIQWEESIDGGITFTPIANTTTTQTYTNITTTTQYRVIIGSNSCIQDTSALAIVTVDPSTVAGTVTGTTTVCATANSGMLTLTGSTGSILRWEQSVDGGITWTNIANITTTQNYTNLTQSTSYRALVQSGVCASIYSGSATITVDPTNVAGSITGTATVCSGSSGTLSLSGQTGAIIRWEESIDGGITFTPIANTTTTQTYTNITTTTEYRVVVGSGGCANDTSTVAIVTVSPSTVAGTVTGTASVCATLNSGTLTLTGSTGSVLRWEQSIDGGITWTNIPNTTTSESYTNLTQTTEYRAFVQSGVCAAIYSGSATITVDSANVAGFITGTATVCSGSSGTLSLSGQTGAIVRWEESIDGGITYTPIANTTTTQTYTNITTTTEYRVIVGSGACINDTSIVAVVTVDPSTVAGTVTGTASVCATANSGILTLTGSTGSVVRWEQSIDGGITWTNIANVTTTENFTNLTQTTNYRALVQSGVCASIYSGSATITVDPANVAGSVTGTATVCSGSSGTLSLSGQTGAIVRWEESTDGGITFTPITNTTTTQTYTNITTSTQYRVVVGSGACINDTSAVAVVTVDPSTVAGTVTGTTSVCATSNSGNLSLVGSTGSVVRWEQSIDGGISWTNIANVTTTQNFTNLTQTTNYRALVQSGVCASIYSGSATITVDPANVAGTITGTATVCLGSSGTLSLSGQTGAIVRWEESIDGGITFTPIANTTTTQTYTNILTTTQYRVVLGSNTCPQVSSAVAIVTVSPSTVAGTVTGTTSVCATSNSGSLSLVGSTGSVLRWEQSIDGGITWTNIANVTTTQNFTNLTQTTEYRALVQSGVCSAIYSVSATVTVTPSNVAGSITGTATVCSGSSGTLSLSGQTGAIQNWEQSIDGGVTFTPIANTTTTQTYTNITTTTQYRVVVGSGSCASVTSAVAIVTVSPSTIAGTVSSSTSVCTGTNSGNLVLIGSQGSIMGWESSIDGGITWTNSVNTTTTQSYSNLTQTTSYRALVQSGVCAPSYSVAATVTVTPTNVAGTIAGTATVCSGSSGTLSLSGQTGTIQRWEQSIDGGITFTPIANTTTTQTYTNITQTTQYRVVVGSGSCPSVTSSAAIITVSPSTIAGTVGPTASVCATANSGNLALAGSQGTILSWESSIDGGLTWTSIANNTTTQNYNNLTQTTSYRAVVQSGVCATLISTSATITVTPANVAGTIAGGTTVCTGSSGVLSLSGQIGAIQRWEQSIDGGITFTPIANTTTTQTYTNITATTQYRVVVGSGSCATVTSAVAIVIVDPATNGGTLSNNAIVCSGLNAGSILLSGSQGSVIRWESSINGGASWTPIVNTTTTLNYLNLTQNTTYRAVVKSGVCPTLFSSTTLISVDSTSVGGTLAGSTSICGPINSGSLSLSGFRGTIVGWESSINAGSTWTNISNTTNSLIYNNLTQTTQYRVRVKYGVCPQAISTVAQVTIFNLPTVTASPVRDTICEGSSKAFTAAGAVSYTWSPATHLNTTVGAVVTATPPTAGLYSWEVRGTDVNGCTDTFTVNLLVQPKPVQQNVSITNASCNGGTGSIQIIVTGGTGLRYSLNGGTTSQLSNTFSGLAAGAYNITVFNTQRCTTTFGPFVVAQPTALTGLVGSSNVTPCFGNANGTITITPNGGTAPYRYSLDNGVTFTAPLPSPQAFTNLSPGLRQIVVLDQNGCQVNLGNVNITQPTQLTATATPTNVSGCFSNSNGSILVNLSNGTPPYRASINGGATYSLAAPSPINFTSLAAGAFDVRVLDAGNCPLLLGIVNVAQPVQLSAAVGSVNVAPCFNNNNGIIAVLNAQGGSGTYEFSINGGTTWQPTGLFPNLAAASYNVRMRDAANPTCVRILNAALVITQPTVVTATVNSTNVSGCFGNNNGAINMTAPSGGSGAYQYSINGGFVWQVSPNFPSLTAGNYIVLVRDAAQTVCVTTLDANLVISQPAQLSGGVTSTNVTGCFGNNNAQINVNGAAGGGGTYEYSIDGGTTWQPSSVFPNLGQGNYTVVVRDAANPTCTRVLNPNLTITEPAELDATVTGSNVTGCFGANNGSIVFSNVTGGSGTYLYSIDSGLTWLPGGSFFLLGPGLYYTAIQDQANPTCVKRYYPALSLVNPGQLNANVNLVPVTSCPQNIDGQIFVINPVGGSGSYEYTIDGGTTWQLSPNFANLPVGTYDVQMRDANFPTCIYVINSTLAMTAGPSPTAQVQVRNVANCFGALNGQIEMVNSTGGSGQFEYSIDSGLTYQTSPIFTNLDTGTYYVYIRDRIITICNTYLGYQVVGSPTAVSFTYLVRTPVCALPNTPATVAFAATGGVPPYEYSNDGGVTFFPDDSLTNVPRGNNILVVRDAVGCTATIPINVTFFVKVDVDVLSVTPPSCFGAQDGIVRLTCKSGVPPFQFLWSQDVSINDSVAFNLKAAQYFVQVIDSNGCFDNLTVIVNEPPKVEAGPDVNICYSTVAAPFVVGVGSPAGGQWSGVGITDPTTGFFDPSVTPGSGTYSAFYTVLGCTDEILVNLVQSSPDQNFDVCQSATDFFSPIISPSFPGVWSSTDPNLAINPTTGRMPLDRAGLFELDYTMPGNCVNKIFVNVVPLPKLELSTNASKNRQGNYVVIAPPATISLEDVQVVQPGFGPYTYFWDFGDGQTSSFPAPTHEYSAFGTYNIRVRITNSLGCTHDTLITADILVNYIGNDTAEIATAFSPNGDGRNEQFIVIPSLGFDQQCMRVYNRQGSEVFNNNCNPGEYWDGNHNGTQCPEGVYFYVFEANNNNAKRTYQKRGTVMLIR
jgi:gliding motility-associated-like protein